MENTRERIFITGGAGFMGTRLAARLADTCDVVLFDNLHRHAIDRTNVLDHDNVTLVEGDVLDVEAVAAAMDGAHVVIHLAAIAGVDSVLDSPVRAMRVNMLGAASVVEAAAALGPQLRRFVLFSTSEVFGRHAYKVEETHETSGGSVGEGRWTYAVSKLASEYFAHAYYDEHQLPLTIVRPFNIYGPGQVGEGAIHHFLARGLRGEDLQINGDGSQIRAWCYVDDIVDAVLRMLEVDASVGQAFNIGNPRSVCTTWDLAQRIHRITGEQSAIRFRELSYSDVEIRIPNVDKARDVLGWEPAVDLDDGLMRTMEWYKQHLAAGVIT